MTHVLYGPSFKKWKRRNERGSWCWPGVVGLSVISIFFVYFEAFAKQLVQRMLFYDPFTAPSEFHSSSC